MSAAPDVAPVALHPERTGDPATLLWRVAGPALHGVDAAAVRDLARAADGTGVLAAVYGAILKTQGFFKGSDVPSGMPSKFSTTLSSPGLLLVSGFAQLHRLCSQGFERPSGNWHGENTRRSMGSH